MDDAEHRLRYSDTEGVACLIKGAKKGGADGLACAWQLIDELDRLFSERVAGTHGDLDLLGLAFVQALAKAWNRAYDVANPPELRGTPQAYVSGQSPQVHAQQLVPALKVLGLVSARGRRKAGDDPMVQRQAAWTRLEAAATAFSAGSRLEQWLAEFFKALLAIRDAKDLMVPAKDLLPAFDCMHLIRPHNRQLSDDGEVAALLATEELVRQVLAGKRNPPEYKHGDAEAARKIAGAITNIDPARLAAVRKKHPGIARMVSPNADADHEGSWLSVAELEGLAGTDKAAIAKLVR
jgi:hypothetical protein